MKQEYNIRDRVWIHLGERNLVEGRVVEIITLDHLKEDHIPGRELYVIEIKTGIEDVYEVRDFDTISSDAKGPINAFRNVDAVQAHRFLKKVGMSMPVDLPDVLEDQVREINDELNDPTPDQIHAALALAEKKPTTIFKPNEKTANKKPRRRTFTKRKKNDNINSNT